jgi:proton-translocating NADH-quinone oxidoreductase chain L
MGQNKHEYPLLYPLIPLLLLVPLMKFVFSMDSFEAAFLIVVVPLLTFPTILIVGQIFNKNDTWKEKYKEGGIIALGSLGISLSVTLWILIDYLSGTLHFSNLTVIEWFQWISFDFLQSDYTINPQRRIIGVGIWIDSISLMILFVATFLCFLICWFSMGYMNTDPINEDRNHRFYAEFVLFSMGMFGMVLADSFLWLFIFWEIMGLCSYLLIGFYYWKVSAAYAAKKAFLTTRIGDVFLMVGLFILYDIYGSLSFEVIFEDPSTGVAGALVDSNQLFWALLLLFVGAVGKSAQFPLHVWLPDAMEGPTPVSALIHAATMVNAGLYLVARMVPFFDVHHHGLAGLENLGIIIAFIGGITAFMAASIAFVQNDIKKVLAYSTMSQLAYIFTGLGVALWFYNTDHHHAAAIAFGASMFHLFNHAMAKGMLFMASGSVIHEVHHAHDHIHDAGDGHDFDPQDMRNMGGLASKMPITATAMMFGSMSIIGVPLIGGFWSKEGIIAETWKAALEEEPLMFFPAILILATAGMTGFYMSRMWLMTFAGEPKSDVVNHVHESTPWIREPLLILTAVTALGGFILALFGAIDFLSNNTDHLKMHGILETLEHAFLPEDLNTKLIGWTTIVLSFIIGPIMAARVHGGSLKEGEKAIQPIGFLVTLSGKFGTQDVEELSKSQLSEALQNRLYFDNMYEYVISKTIIPFANMLAWFDRTIIDGIIKQIESKSVLGSLQVRRVTTGSARDYILLAAVGMLSIFVLIWGVNA